MREEELANLIYLYGEEKLSRRIAHGIVEARRGGKIESSKALADIIFDSVPGNYRYGPIHPATRTFQALRIAVNSELRHIPEAIHNAFNNLNAGGKMGVITFHSLEDRIVKNYFRNLGGSAYVRRRLLYAAVVESHARKYLQENPLVLRKKK